MFILTLKFGDPVFIMHEGQVLTIYTSRKPNSRVEFFGAYEGPRDFLILRPGAKCTWPKEENTIMNKQGMKND